MLTQWPWPVFCAPLTLTQFTLTFQIFSTIRRTTLWMYRLGRYLDLVTLTYILRSSDFDIFCVEVRYLLNYKAYNHQTLQSASPQCTDLADTLTWWPWPIFCCRDFDIMYVNVPTLHSASPQCTDSAGTLTGLPWPIFHAPLTFTPFTSPFHMSLTVRPSTTKPYIALLLDVLTRRVPWPGDLDLYCALQWLWHILYWCSVSPQI